MAKFGTFDELVAEVPMELALIARSLKRLILAQHPDAVEVVRLGDRAASYGLGPKKMSEAYAYIMPQQRWVNLGFYHGANLPDPNSLLAGTGKRLRHVKVRTVGMVEEPALVALVAAALAERREALER